MIRKISEYDKFFLAIGFRDVKIADINRLLARLRNAAKPASVQLFDADRIAGSEHLFFAALNALKAFYQKQNISNSLAVETLLYASGQRQIQRAINMLGVKPDTSRIAVLVLASTERGVQGSEEKISALMDGVRDDQVVGVGSEEKIRNLTTLFGITELELETKMEKKANERKAVTELIIERGALLVTKR